MSNTTTATTTPTTPRKERSDPYKPYHQLVLGAFRYNVQALLDNGSFASRTALHNAYVAAVGDISASAFAEWLDEAGFKFTRTVNVTSTAIA